MTIPELQALCIAVSRILRENPELKGIHVCLVIGHPSAGVAMSLLNQCPIEIVATAIGEAVAGNMNFREIPEPS